MLMKKTLTRINNSVFSNRHCRTNEAELDRVQLFSERQAKGLVPSAEKLESARLGIKGLDL